VRYLDPATGSIGDVIRTVSADGFWALSRDGKWFAFADYEDNVLEVGPLDPSEGGAFQFSAPRQPNVPAFSHDGNTLFYTEGVFPTELDAWARPLDGGAPEDLDFGGHRFEFVLGDSRDGRFLLATVTDDWAGTAEHLLVNRESGEKTVIHRSRIWDTPTFSPDERWIAYADGEDVFVRGFDGSGPWRIATGRSGPQWSPDGNTLYVRDQDNIYAVPLEIARGIRPATERMIYQGTGALAFVVNSVSGEVLFVDRAQSQQDVVERLDVVFNWGEWLKQEAPMQ
jgi:Tol biopolymer transport system component